MFREFEQIPKKKATAEYTVASNPAYKDKNRFKDVLPYDENRVSIQPMKDNQHGYINASHVKVSLVVPKFSV